MFLFLEKKQIHVVDCKHKTRGTRHSMLQSFPAYAVHSAVHFQDLACWVPEPVASGQTVASGQIARQRSGTRAEPAGEEEDYVFV